MISPTARNLDGARRIFKKAERDGNRWAKHPDALPPPARKLDMDGWRRATLRIAEARRGD